jgi:hypothetical protein
MNRAFVSFTVVLALCALIGGATTATPAVAGTDISTFNALLLKNAPLITTLVSKFRPKAACACNPANNFETAPGVVALDQSGHLLCWLPSFDANGKLLQFDICNEDWVPLPH